MTTILAIVTVRVKRDPYHYPKDKKVGICPLRWSEGLVCTDVTGEHHSYIESGKHLGEIQKKAEARFGHVTRIEVIEKELTKVVEK